MNDTVQQTPQSGHVGLDVTDLNRSLRFYQEALGFQVLHQSAETGREFAFLGDGERVVLTLWQQSKGAFSTTTPGLHHLAFEVTDMDAVRAAEARLRALQTSFLYDGVVAWQEGVAAGGLYFTDPDGIRLEIYAPSGAEEQSAPAGSAPACGFF